MRKREDTARFIEAQMTDTSELLYAAKHQRVHYGWHELRILMDFIYEGHPQTDAENLKSDRSIRGVSKP